MITVTGKAGKRSKEPCHFAVDCELDGRQALYFFSKASKQKRDPVLLCTRETKREGYPVFHCTKAAEKGRFLLPSLTRDPEGEKKILVYLLVVVKARKIPLLCSLDGVEKGKILLSACGIGRARNLQMSREGEFLTSFSPGSRRSSYVFARALFAALSSYIQHRLKRTSLYPCRGNDVERKIPASV